MTGSLNTPVLLLLFNRPEVTVAVFDAIRRAAPARVYLAADGPRGDRPGEAARCVEARSIVSRVDWPCAVKTLFREENLGCKHAVSSAIDWFFEHEAEGIILEDDCLPGESFFPFARELLERYRDDHRIAMISGDNFLQGRRRTGYSYYFSRYAHIWGWATWRRAWRWYDHGMKLWPELREGGWLLDILGDPAAASYWTRVFDETHADRNGSWAFRWMFSIWAQSGLAILPNANLVSNIGFGEQATHTVSQGSALAQLRTAPMAFPLGHPPYVIRDGAADAHTQSRVFSAPPFWRRVANRARRALMPATGR
ncbi:MAG: glycosyltransferase family 2 protein [Betaproteobacteria bacterium]|nr:glycosyltransferase family 2 protein [Betaproteobacteria bacterium]